MNEIEKLTQERDEARRMGVLYGQAFERLQAAVAEFADTHEALQFFNDRSPSELAAEKAAGAELAWRALTLLQREIELEEKAHAVTDKRHAVTYNRHPATGNDPGSGGATVEKP